MTLAERFQDIRQRIADAALKSGRSPEEVRLCAVSKTFPATAVEEAADTGQLLFGENRVQECMEKIPLCRSGLEWHLIGHLQSNKVRRILPLVGCIQSVDSVDLARDIHRIALDLALPPVPVLFQVNISADDAKYGFSPAEADFALEAAREFSGISVHGLMTIPRLDLDAEAARPHFTALRELRDRLSAQSGMPLPVLSMGMSGDFAVAIEEGATLVRVGSALFGGR